MKLVLELKEKTKVKINKSRIEVKLKFERPILRCPYCGSTHIIQNPITLEYVCKKCASVISPYYTY